MLRCCQMQADTDPLHLGSVALWVVSQTPQPVPVVVVRNWDPQPEPAGQSVPDAAEAAQPSPAAVAASAAKKSARAEEAQQGGVASAAAAAAELMAATAGQTEARGL